VISKWAIYSNVFGVFSLCKVACSVALYGDTKSYCDYFETSLSQKPRVLSVFSRHKIRHNQPFFAVVICQAASNHIVNGVRVLSKIVPAVTLH